ncbi:DEAD/DEAH box helicase [Aureimonas sp. Leaf324]|uniref:DEAD/DEAH box helicase n=1 Tax=Aureimonas sp. Leaf324 TaxID=1736336 RepID=UPI0006F6CA17|nr:DEAD/DEAH box helicase [Aureimonas sp. Leaf324]KQQ86258.1 DEAD/DEAH box helicase [Aureimonas sp. Leaf324]
MPPSGSERRDGYDRLHVEIRRWIHEEGWSELRDIQERTIHPILDGGGHVLISASTAAGKTEAAFLPILTQVAGAEEAGLSVVYVAPLKALINDQYRRLLPLCERLEMPIVRWHGDAPQADKTRTLRNPRGVVLITPESLEAMFVRRSGGLGRLFGNVRFVVVDELHAFLSGPRGLHLHSLLNRLDGVAGRTMRRVGLSATIGDPQAAAEWMAPGKAETVVRVDGAAGSPEILLQVRAVLEAHDVDDPDALEDIGARRALDLVADHVFQTLRGDNNLLFAGSRRRVEAMVDRLRQRSDDAGTTNEFFPHHGSLSRELREELEGRLKAGTPPTTAVATTTLELGIDIGSVKSVAQIGAPRSLAGLRQRLGRSGRRKGVPAVLRIYVRERDPTTASDLIDRLHMDVVRAVAAIRLLVAKFVEPPGADPSIATVVLHQILSIICERGGEKASRLYADICGKGPLAALGKGEFVALLRAMAGADSNLLEQAPDGTIMLGEAGEVITTGRDFYAIFETDQEWKLVSEQSTLGTIPVANSVGVGSLLAFAGRRWRIVDVDDRTKTLRVEIHRAGKLPMFEGLVSEPMHDRLLSEMRSVYEDVDVPGYLDGNAKALLQQARTVYRAHDLASIQVLAAGGDTQIFLWRGTAMASLFAIALTSQGLRCSGHDVGVTATNATPEMVIAALQRIADDPKLTVSELANAVGNLREAKFDRFVPEELLRHLWIVRNRGLELDLRTLARELAVKITTS